MTSPGKPTIELDPSFADRRRHTFAKFASIAQLGDHVSDVSIIGRLDIDGTPVVHLRLTSQELGSVDSFVNRTTGLLVKTSTKTADPFTGVESTIEMELSDYREIDGIPVPMTLKGTSNGKTLISVKISDLEFKKSIPASTFAKPN